MKKRNRDYYKINENLLEKEFFILSYKIFETVSLIKLFDNKCYKKIVHDGFFITENNLHNDKVYIITDGINLSIIMLMTTEKIDDLYFLYRFSILRTMSNIQLKDYTNINLTALLKSPLNDRAITHLTDESSLYIYSLCHDMFLYGGNLYIVLKLNKNKYLAKDVAKILTLFNELICIEREIAVNAKISINSPGEIQFVIENAVNFFNENWKGLLLIYILFFGGKLHIGSTQIEATSIVNFINFILDRRYNKEKRSLELDDLKETVRGKKIDNDSKEEKTTEGILDMYKELLELVNKYNATPVCDKATDIEVIEHILETPIDDEDEIDW